MLESSELLWRGRLKTGLRWAMAILLVVLIVYYLAENRSEFFSAASALSWRDLVILIFLQTASYALQSWRSQIIVERLIRRRLPFHGWFRLFVVSRLLNTFLSQAGNLYRAYNTKKFYALSYTKYAATAAVFLWIDTITNVALVCGLLLWTRLMSPQAITAETPSVTLATLLLIGLLLAPLIGTVVAHYMLRFGSFLAAPRRWLRDAIDSFWISVRDPGMIVRVVGVGIVALGVMMAMFFIAFAGIDIPIPPWQAAAVIVLYRLTLAVNITPGNIGIREWAIVGAAALFGIDATAAMTVAVVTRVTGTIGLLLVGLPAALMPHPLSDLPEESTSDQQLGAGR